MQLNQMCYICCRGHAKGLQPLAGKYIDFCSDNNNEIYGDPQVYRCNELSCLKKKIDKVVVVVADSINHLSHFRI
jgi:hypothetical protein